MKTRRLPMAMIALAVCAAIAGCGSSSTASTGSSSGGSTTSASATSSGTSSSANGISSSTLASLKTTVAQAEAVPAFKAPGPAFSASAAKGKTIVAVPLNSQIPYCSGIISSMQSIGSKVGVKVTNYPSSGEVSQYQQAATMAGAQGANAFTTVCGINPASITPQLAALKSKKIASVALLGDVSLPAPPTVTAGTAIQLGVAAKDLVDDAAVQNNGKPFDALILTDYDLFGANVPTKAAAAELTRICGSKCKSTTMSVPQTSWASGISSTVSTELLRDPKITAVIALYDGMVPGMVDAVQNLHRNGLKIYTYGASEGVVKLIPSTHGVVAADIGASTPWTAYVQMDQLLRVLSDKPALPTSAEYPPLRLWDLSNASQFSSPDSYGNAYQSGFMKLWGE